MTTDNNNKYLLPKCACAALTITLHPPQQRVCIITQLQPYYTPLKHGKIARSHNNNIIIVFAYIVIIARGFSWAKNYSAGVHTFVITLPWLLLWNNLWSHRLRCYYTAIERTIFIAVPMVTQKRVIGYLYIRIRHVATITIIISSSSSGRGVAVRFSVSSHSVPDTHDSRAIILPISI